MIEIQIPSVKFTFDVEGFKKDFQAHVEKVTKDGAREFAKVALSKIPVRTGFVAGSFGTLTELLGAEARMNPIVAFTRRALASAKRFFRPSKPRTVEYYYPSGGGKIAKSPDAGRQFATPADKIFTWEGDVFHFAYEVDISYFRVNDSVPGHAPSAPWHAFLSAQTAFEAYLAQHLIKADFKMEKYFTFT